MLVKFSCKKKKKKKSKIGPDNLNYHTTNRMLYQSKRRYQTDKIYIDKRFSKFM